MPSKDDKAAMEIMQEMLRMDAMKASYNKAFPPLKTTGASSIDTKILTPGRITPTSDNQGITYGTSTTYTTDTTGGNAGTSFIYSGTGMGFTSPEDNKQITKTLVTMKYGNAVYKFVIDWTQLEFTSVSISKVDDYLISGGGYTCNCGRQKLIQRFYEGSLSITNLPISDNEQPGIELLEHKNIINS